jgi:hypothetical protein
MWWRRRSLRARLTLATSAGLALALALAAVLLLAPAARAADLARIERTIAREPAYRTKNPLYGLLVFGPAAKTRVWVVLDGTDLYVDTNGDGDLTAPAKRFANDGRGWRFPAGYKAFKPFEIADRAGKDRYKVLAVGVHRPDKEKRVFVMATVEVVGKYKQYCDLTLSPRLKESSVCHFHGPLTMGLREYNWKPVAKLTTGDKPADLFAWVGTFDKANGCWVVLENTVIDRPDYKRKDFPTDIHPVAEVEFAPKRPGDKPIRVRHELKQRC